MLAVRKRQLAADPSKWQPGDGVAWNVTGDQINRGFRIVEVRPETKEVVIRQVADTGLTSTGGNDPLMGNEFVSLGDIKRDRKYDAPAAARTVEPPPAPDLAPPAAPAPAPPPARAGIEAGAAEAGRLPDQFEAARAYGDVPEKQRAAAQTFASQADARLTQEAKRLADEGLTADEAWRRFQEEYPGAAASYGEEAFRRAIGEVASPGAAIRADAEAIQAIGRQAVPAPATVTPPVQPTTVPAAVQVQAARRARPSLGAGRRVQVEQPPTPAQAATTPPQAASIPADAAPTPPQAPTITPPAAAAGPTPAQAAQPPAQPPVQPEAQVPSAPPPPGGRLSRFLPTGDIMAAIGKKAKGLLGNMTAEPPTPTPARPVTGQTGAVSLGPLAAGIKRATAVVDPWLVATEYQEKLPLVWRSLEDTGRNIVKQAMQPLDAQWGKIRGVTIKDNIFTQGVTPRTAHPGASLAVGDVIEHSYRYDMPDALREWIRLAHETNDELMAWAKAEGVKIRELGFEPGGHYFGRVVKEVRDVEKRLRTNPGQARVYDSMEAGIRAGVTYADDPMAVAETGFGWLVRKITSKRMGDLVQPLGRTPSQLIDKVLTDNALAAVKKLRTLSNGERTVKAIRDGMATTYQMRGHPVRRPQIGQLDVILPGTALKIEQAKGLTGAARRAEFQTILDDLAAEKKVAGKEYKETKGKRARAIEGLRSAEWAEAAKFGLPGGTIGLGRIEAPFAQGRLFPRDVADYLSGQFNRETNKLLQGVNSVSAAGRLLTTSFDLGTMFIQLLPVLSHPKAWAKAAGYMFASLADPRVYKAYMDRQDVQDVLRKLVPQGLTLEGAEHGEALQQGLTLQRVMPKAVSTRLALLFEAPLNVAKVEMAKGLLPLAERRGELRELAGFLNNVTGTQSLLGQGIGANQRLAEGAFVFFSPRYTRASLALISQALTGGVGGAEARKSLGAVAAALILGPMALNRMRGQEEHEGYFDPTSPWFLSAEVFGRRVGFGGIFRSLTAMLGSSLKDAQEDPQAFVSPSRMENPLLRWLSGRSAPATSLLWDAAAGRDFLGEPLYTPGQWTRRIAKSTVPMWSQEFIPEPGQAPQTAESVIPDIFGMRSVPLTTAQRREQKIEEVTGEEGKKWADLDTVDRWEMQEKNPELKALVQQGLEERARRGDVVGEFWFSVQQKREPLFAEVQALTEQLKAGKITPQRYRDELSRREAMIAQIPEITKRGDPRYGQVPLTDAEKTAYYKGRPEQQPSPTDQYLDEYYGLVSQFIDPATNTADVAKLMQAREALKAKTDPATVERATRYVNRNRDPDYVQALNLYREYQSLPRYRGISKVEEEQYGEAARLVLQYRKQYKSNDPAGMDKARRDATRARPGLTKYIRGLSGLSQRKEPARQRFWDANKGLLERFFGVGTPEASVAIGKAA